MKTRVLFICKQGENYGSYSSGVKKYSGLKTSTNYVSDSLNNDCEIESKVVIAHDNNDIDRLLAEYKPNICIIEALWVVPEKFKVLKRLHPTVTWYVHLHSNIPFLANEGIAMEWIPQYPFYGVGILVNCKNAYDALAEFIHSSMITYLPNVYERKVSRRLPESKEHLDIACFGAIRPLKNQLIQAMAAITYANDLGKPLRFHMNNTRIVTGGIPVFKNIQQLFNDFEGAKLVLHTWRHPDDLHECLRSMHMGMQVSLSETFNIVTADYVTAGIPVVGSDVIPWISRYSEADPASVSSIVDTMHRARKHRYLVAWNQKLLKDYSRNSAKLWKHFIKSNKEAKV